MNISNPFRQPRLVIPRTGAADKIGHVRISPEVVTELIAAAEAMLVFVSALLANIWFAQGASSFVSPPPSLNVLGLGLTCAVMVYTIQRQLSLDARVWRRSIVHSVGRAALAIGVAFSSLILLLVVLGLLDEITWGFFAVWLALSALLVLLAHRIFVLYLYRLVEEGRFKWRVAIYGGGELAKQVAHSLMDSDSESVLVGIFNDPDPKEAIDTLPRMGSLRELVAIAQAGQCDRIIVALPSQKRFPHVMKTLRSVPTPVQWCPDAQPVLFPVQGAAKVSSLLLINVQDSPVGPRGKIYKSLMDYVLATTALAALTPLMTIIAIAIKLDSPGPVFFVQSRGGYRGRVIRVLKFRTMTVLEDGPFVLQAQRNDKRITRIGRLLRRTSLDELPQLINVLRGDLSLVGPRPHPIALDEKYENSIEEYPLRYKVKPGITGFAQVNGLRGETRDPALMRQRIACDNYYIDNWSLAFDLRIMLKTITAIVGSRAY